MYTDNQIYYKQIQPSTNTGGKQAFTEDKLNHKESDTNIQYFKIYKNVV